MSEPEKLMEQIRAGEIPDDLQWMVQEFKLQPNDPAFLLLIWHWKRIAQVHDQLHEEANVFRSALEVCMEKVDCRIADWQKVAATIVSFQEMLGKLSCDLGQRLEKEMQRPISESLVASQQLEARLNGLLAKVAGQNKQSILHMVIGCVLAGFAFGTVIITWILFHYYSR